MLDACDSSVPVRVYLGGTFNPIHIGHARLLLDCQVRLNAVQACFVPSATPPHKPEPELRPDQRVLLTRQVVEELNGLQDKAGVFGVEMCELERNGLSYTLDTLQYLRTKSPNDCIVWVIGMDSLVNLASWHRWQELLHWANLLVVNRPGWNIPKGGPVAHWLDANRCALDQLPLFGGVAFFNTAPLDVSSSDIREGIKQGLSAKYLLPEPVLTYIQQHGYYFTT